ncbi:hypothetical protein [Microbacterium lacus]|uniref:hypothetical protein n=1 Tax=Microbacterium lacus TaxID=415217 RepID=UPI000C2BFDF7|nr:hypothetical protein [Microbacterium lacus]
MTAVRVARVGLQEQPGLTTVRVGKVALTGLAPAAVKVRVEKVALTGTAAVAVNPIAAITAEPESVVTLTASLTGGGNPDSWTWRRVSGNAVTLTGTGASRTLRAPSGMPPVGGSVVIGIIATVGGVNSPERTVTITTLPQIRWQYQSGAWVGSRSRIEL